jgi:hypothetical protein
MQSLTCRVRRFAPTTPSSPETQRVAGGKGRATLGLCLEIVMAAKAATQATIRWCTTSVKGWDEIEIPVERNN